MARAKDQARPRSAAIYCRISQDRAGDQLGVERQRELCERLVDAYGWTVADLYVDDNISAYSRKPRPAYVRMLEDVRARKVDAVVAVDQDRIGRRLSELSALLDLLGELNVPIVTAAGDLDSTTADGRLKIHILGSVAEHESAKKSERIRRQRDQAARMGKPHGGRRPFGYEPGRAGLRADEADLVHEAARRVLDGETLRALALDWNTRGLRSPSGSAWTVTTLRSMLTSPGLAGLRVHRGEVVGPADWPAILEEDTHRALRVVLGDPRRRRKGRPATSLLGGIVHCGRCGGPLWYSTRVGDGARRYACSPGPGRINCGRLAIVAAPLDDLVAAAIVYRLESTATSDALAAARRAPDVAAEVFRLEVELEELSGLYGEGRLSQREWLRAREPLERRVADARAAIATVPPTVDLAELAADPRAAWDRLAEQRRRKIVAALVERVTIAPADRPGAPFDPDRVDIVWRV